MSSNYPGALIVNSTPPSGGSNASKYLIIGGVGVAALLLLSRNKASVPPLTSDQKDLLLQAGTSDIKDVSVLPLDKSPRIMSSTSSALPVETLDTALKKHYSAYENRCAAISSRLKTDAVNVFATVAILFNTLPKGQIVTTAALDGYFKVLDIWSQRFDFALETVSKAVNQILVAQIAGLSTAQKCVQWDYIKSTDVTQSNSSLKSAVVTNTGRASQGFLGIIGKSQTNSSTIVNTSSVTATIQEKVTFIPHCKQYQLDPSVVLSVLGSSSAALSVQYELLSAVMAMAPKPEAFITNVQN